MRFTFFAAVVAACNLISDSQASSLIQNEMQLFEEPATIFTQVEQPAPKKPAQAPKETASKEGPKKLKPTQVDEGTAKGGPKTAPLKGAPKETAPKEGPKK